MNVIEFEHADWLVAWSMRYAEYVVVALALAFTVTENWPSELIDVLAMFAPLQVLFAKIFTVENASPVPLMIGVVDEFDGDVGFVVLLSTGALAMAHVYKRKPAVSMLVVKMEAEYFKKATDVTRFICTNGKEFREAITAALETGQPQVLTAYSEGKNPAGDLVARFTITWSFKAKAV